ncbi:hypothetical protein BC937DRAFT_90448 [Endogone sp. FLAS-F59071]|nr:hypothetical protein BC937DRAFT_90448 [Endogone sp. FLAS-F59071]|eukprot:RUS17081.1 hypothetical protein BC937DRAFT_90448 [Endogone sp. FLAS-F59071]
MSWSSRFAGVQNAAENYSASHNPAKFGWEISALYMSSSRVRFISRSVHIASSAYQKWPTRNSHSKCPGSIKQPILAHILFCASSFFCCAILVQFWNPVNYLPHQDDWDAARKFERPLWRWSAIRFDNETKHLSRPSPSIFLTKKIHLSATDKWLRGVIYGDSSLWSTIDFAGEFNRRDRRDENRPELSDDIVERLASMARVMVSCRLEKLAILTFLSLIASLFAIVS